MAVALSASRQSASLRVVFVYTVVPRGTASHVFTVAGAGSVLSRPWSWTTAALRDVLLVPPGARYVIKLQVC